MTAADRLYALLPAVYRLRDAEQGEPLRALLRIVEEEFSAVHDDIEGLYADWFVETCSEAMVPYLGDLVGVRGLSGASDGLPSERALVANAIAWRRRKGTTAMLEELARSVTGWDARALPTFEALAWSQNANHVRYERSPAPDKEWAYPPAETWVNPAPNNARRRRDVPAYEGVGTVNLRHRDHADRVGGAFDDAGHAADVRSIGQQEGWHNVRNVALHLWRLEAYPLRDVTAAKSQAAAHGWHFNPLGHPTTLFHLPETDASYDARVQERHVAAPIRPVALGLDLLARAQEEGEDADAPDTVLYGPRRGLSVRLVRPAGVETVPPAKVLARDLSTWEPVEDGYVGIDPKLGRLVVGGTAPTKVLVTFCHGFSADLGGGAYDLPPDEDPADALHFAVDPSDGEAYGTLASALADALLVCAKAPAVVEIADSGTYAEDLTLDLPPGGRLVLRAAPRQRPLLRPTPTAPATPTPGENPKGWVVRLGDGATLDLRGVAVAGAGILLEPWTDGTVGEDIKDTPCTLRLSHATLVPGLDRMERPDSALPVSGGTPSLRSLRAKAAPLTVELERCILGPIRMPPDLHAVHLKDCILDAPEVLPALTDAQRQGSAPLTFLEPPAPRVAVAADAAGDLPGPSLRVERSTVLGLVHVREMPLGSESIFTRHLLVERRQVGCVRYSWFPEGSFTPRRFRCQPELATQDKSDDETARILARLAPTFTSVHYGEPGYAQLGHRCAPEIRTGAEDGSEMGAFRHLKNPQREKNLRARLDEFLPFGLRAGLVYMS